MPDYPSPAAKRRRIVQNIVTALSLILSVVLIIVLATAEPDSSVYQRGYDSGHATGYVEGGNDAIGPAYDRGYAAGEASAKREARRAANTESLVSSDRSRGSTSSHSSSEPTGTSYIANTSTGKFHRSTCSYLPEEQNRAYYSSAEEARAAGYSPCGHCHP